MFIEHSFAGHFPIFWKQEKQNIQGCCSHETYTQCVHTHTRTHTLIHETINVSIRAVNGKT